MNLPNPKENIEDNPLKSKIHPLEFIFEDPMRVENNDPFEYY